MENYVTGLVPQPMVLMEGRHLKSGAQWKEVEGTLGLVPFRFFSFWYLWAHSCHKANTGLKQKGQMTMDFLPLTQYLAVFQGPTSPRVLTSCFLHQSRAEHRKTKYIQQLAHQFMFPPWGRFSASLHQTNSHLLFRVSHSLN